MNAVVVHPQLRFLFGGAVAGVGLEGVVFTRQAHWVAPGRNDLGEIAFGHDDGIGAGHRDALEAQQRAGTGRGGAAGQRAGSQGRQH